MSKGPTDESMCCCRLLLTELASRQESLNIRYADIYRVGRRAFMCYGCVAALMVMLSARTPFNVKVVAPCRKWQIKFSVRGIYMGGSVLYRRIPAF